MSFWTSLRDIGEAALPIAGNYFLPGSGLVTQPLMSKIGSKGSQKIMSNPLYTLANIGVGGIGAGVGQSLINLPSASDMGAGWTNAINGLGGAFGSPTAGTDLSARISGMFSGTPAQSASGNGGTFSFGMNGQPTGASTLTPAEQMSPSQVTPNLGLSESASANSNNPNLTNIMRLLGGGMGQGQQGNNQQMQPSAAPAFGGGAGANMQSIFDHIRNMQQQMTPQTGGQGSLGSNISSSINPYFSGYRPY